MDDRQFDALARSLGSGASRRRVLAGLMAGALGAVSLGKSATDAARRGYGGPGQPTPTGVAGSCTPICDWVGCGMSDGCGGICGCSSEHSCIRGVCATACNLANCHTCIEDGLNAGCFWETGMTCSTNADCTAQYGVALCEQDFHGQYYCYLPNLPN